MKSRAFFLLKVVLFTALFLYGVYFLFFQTEILKITEIQYNKNENLSEQELYSYSGIEKGMFFFQVDTYRATENLKKHPYVKDAGITVSLPNRIRFEISYREHLFSVSYSDIVLSLDEDLHVLRVLSEPDDGYLVNGYVFDSFSVGSVINVEQLYLLRNIVVAVRLFEQFGIPANKNITVAGGMIEFSIGDIFVEFGSGEHMEDKFKNFNAIYHDLRNQGVTFGTIDVSSDGLPVYRPFGE